MNSRGVTACGRVGRKNPLTRKEHHSNLTTEMISHRWASTNSVTEDMRRLTNLKSGRKGGGDYGKRTVNMKKGALGTNQVMSTQTESQTRGKNVLVDAPLKKGMSKV